MNIITQKDLQNFENALYLDEKAKTTIQKYLRAVQQLSHFLQGEELTKRKLLEFRDHLLHRQKTQTVNGALSAIHAFLDFRGWKALRINLLKVQRQSFLAEDRELSQAEYRRLLMTAKQQRNERLYLLMMTLGGTGIRVGELPFITVKSASIGRADISLKGKKRVIILQKKLRVRLIQFAKKRGIKQGPIFCTQSGNPLDRSNICHEMKRLSQAADVDPRKVFPHNLRHLFARTFFAVEKNLAHLADVLGHSRIETTRIYVAVSATAHERVLSRMHLIL